MRPVARLRDLLVNVALRVELTPTEAVSIVKLKDNSVVAVGDSCCHKDAKLSKGDIEDLGVGVSACVGDGTELGGVCLRCPKHKKKFAGTRASTLTSRKVRLSHVHGLLRFS